jgi:hypothetical protein
MADNHTVQRCRWAQATLLVEDLTWTEAEAYPWSCTAEGDPHTVEETERCLTCGRWVPREPEPARQMHDCPDFRR